MYDACLTKEAERLFPRLVHFRKYHLVRGTALALQIGHRISYDFDLFTEEPLAPNLFQTIKKVFPSEKIIQSFRSKEQCDIFVSGIKVTFRYFPFPTMYPFVKHRRVSLLSIQDIAASKAFAIGQRAAYRDYVDVYFILKERYATLGEIIALSEKKFKKDFNGRLFLEQLVYLGDITDTKVEFIRSPISKQALIRELKKKVKEHIDTLAA